MRFSKFLLRRTALAGTIATLTVLSLPVITHSQGLTIFSGVPAEKQLSSRVDFGGNPSAFDRYRLRIDKKKMKLAAAQFVIDYPDYFDGKLDPKNVELYVNGKKVALQEVKWDEENFFIELFPQEPVPAGSSVEIMLSNVKNPRNNGMYYFNCRVLTPGDAPLLRDIGTWIIEIS